MGCESHYQDSNHIQHCKETTTWDNGDVCEGCGDYCENEPRCRFSMFNEVTAKCYLYDEDQTNNIAAKSMSAATHSIYTCYRKA